MPVNKEIFGMSEVTMSDSIDVLKARIAELESDKNPWKDMSTAPKDGKHSIFAIKFGPFVYSIQGWWDQTAKKWINASDRDGEYLAWMPNIMVPDEFLPWTDSYKKRK